MKKGNVYQIRLSDSEIEMLNQLLREFRIDVDASCNRADFIRSLIKDKYQDYISQGRIKPEEIVGGGYGLFM